MATIYSSVTTGPRPQFVTINRRVYMTDGWRPVQVWDGIASSTSDAGITGPSQEDSDWSPTPTEPNAGSVTAGDHSFRYRYKNSVTGYVSNASNEIDFTTAGSKDVQFSINNTGSSADIQQPASGSQADRIVLEMTTAGGSTFFEAGEVAASASTINVDLTDVQLAELTPLYPLTGNNLPPIAANMIAHRGRLFMFGQIVYSEGTADVTNADATVSGNSTDWTVAIEKPDITNADTLRNRAPRFFQVDGDAVAYEIATQTSGTEFELVEAYGGSTDTAVGYRIFSRDNNLYVSTAAYPESFPSANFVAGPEFGQITACIGHLSSLVIYALTGMEVLVWSSDPVTDGVKRVVSQQRGALNQHVVIDVEDTVYAMDRRGFTRYAGVRPVHISKEIDNLLDDVNWAVSDTFHCCYYPELKSVRWYVAMDSDTLPKDYFQYSVDNQAWSRGKREIAITASALVPTSTGQRVLVGDENGYTWFDDEGTTEGCATNAESVLTVGSGSSTTVIQIDGTTLTTSGTGQDGVPFYWVEGDETGVVSSNTSSALTLASALTAAPAAGDKVHLGRIKSLLKTKAFTLPTLASKHKARKVRIFFEPLSASTATGRYFRVRFYRDYSSSALVWPNRTDRRNKADSYAGLTFPDPADGGTDWLVDSYKADGVVEVPLGDTVVRVTEVEIEVLEPDLPLRVLGIDLDGVSMDPVT